MNTANDNNMERILNGQPELANTLDKVKQEASRRAVGTNVPHIICMDKDGKLCIRVGEDYQDERRQLVALVYCFTNGKVSEIKQKGTNK